MYMVMSTTVVNIHEAKARLSEFIHAAARGERVLICKRNTPVAELRALGTPRTKPRPLGLAASRFVVPDSFFEPLPDEIVEAFGAPQPAARRVAERPAPYQPAGRTRDARAKKR